MGEGVLVAVLLCICAHIPIEMDDIFGNPVQQIADEIKKPKNWRHSSYMCRKEIWNLKRQGQPVLGLRLRKQNEQRYIEFILINLQRKERRERACRERLCFSLRRNPP